MVLKVPHQFDFLLVSFQINYFCEISNLPSIHNEMQLLCVVFVKSSNKLLNYLILRAQFIEMKMEKMNEFLPW